MLSVKRQNYYTTSTNCYDNGVIFIIDNMAYLLDYNSMQGIPLCNKPNCIHNDSSCIAWQCGSALLPIIYQDCVYYFTASNEVVDAEDGLFQTVEIDGNLNMASLKSGKTSLFVNIQNLDMSKITEAIVIDNILYVIGCYGAEQANDGNWVYYAKGGAQYFCSINLDTGDFTNYGLVNDSPYAKNNVVKKGNSIFSFDDDVIIDGIYNDKIYMHYKFVKDQQELEGIIDNSKEESDINWCYEVKCFDPTTKELSIIDLPPAKCINENNYIYQNAEGNYTIMDSEGGCVTTSVLNTDHSVYLTFVNGKLWSDGLNCCFDVETQNIYEYNEKYVDSEAVVIDFVNDQYVVRYVTESGNMAFDMVSENNLIAK